MREWGEGEEIWGSGTISGALSSVVILVGLLNVHPPSVHAYKHTTAYQHNPFMYKANQLINVTAEHINTVKNSYSEHAFNELMLTAK